MNRHSLICSALVALVIIASPVTAAASTTYVPVGDKIYPLLDRLASEGLISSGLLNTRPISRAEVERLLGEAQGNAADASPFIRELLASLRRQLGPSTADPGATGYGASLYARYIRTDTPLPILQYNNDGDDPAKGSHLRAGADLRLERAGPFAVRLNPEYRDSGPDHDTVLRHGYLVAGISKIDLAIGKDSQWWGPGRHGAILLTNNAEPFTMLRFTNPEPVVLPWIFRHLGPFKFTFFVTQLERDRDYPEPYFWGMRFDFKPSPSFEIGLQRTAILGGKGGRSEDLETWIKSMFPMFGQENTGGPQDPGDQRAGFDLAWTIGSTYQPVQIYLEGDGEDERSGLPNLWAWVGGLYLPRIGALDRVDFRFEIGTTMGRRLSPTVWYNHSVYTSGYTYEDRIIGHHIGTDSRDLYFEFSYRLPKHDARFSLAYDREEHHVRQGDFQEIAHEALSSADFALSRRLDVSAAYSRAWVRNAGNQYSPVQTINSFNGVIRYTF